MRGVAASPFARGECQGVPRAEGCSAPAWNLVAPGARRSRERPAAMRGHLPYFCRGQVVKGLGRGSKELGIPTANFSEQVVESFPSDISTGIYYGWACVGNGDVHKMVLSIGWNPFYKNIKKSVETHVIHTFKEDFYGEILRIVVLGYIRSEKNFSSLEALISAIQEDIEEAKRQLDLPEHLKLKEDNFFHLPEGKNCVPNSLSLQAVWGNAQFRQLTQTGQRGISFLVRHAQYISGDGVQKPSLFHFLTLANILSNSLVSCFANSSVGSSVSDLVGLLLFPVMLLLIGFNQNLL
ncbi:riboflavin kinase-like [Rhynochetos jubatus]